MSIDFCHSCYGYLRYKYELQECLHFFDIIEFAIHCSPYNQDNYNFFRNILLQ